MVQRAVFSLTILLVVGCSEGAPESSTGYAIKDITTSITIDASSNNNVQVIAYLSRSRELLTIPIDVSGGDSLTAYAYGTSKELVRTAAGNYAATFNKNQTETFKVSFLRQGEAGAPNSTVLLPEPFTIGQPANQQTFNNGDTITVTWSPAINHQNMYLGYDIECPALGGGIVTDGAGNNLNDTGSYVIPTSFFRILGDTNIDVTKQCTGQIKIFRREYGTKDPALNGSIVSAQWRTVTFMINP